MIDMKNNDFDQHFVTFNIWSTFGQHVLTKLHSYYSPYESNIYFYKGFQVISDIPKDDLRSFGVSKPSCYWF